jgi:hypothetical protein
MDSHFDIALFVRPSKGSKARDMLFKPGSVEDVLTGIRDRFST